MAEKKGNTEKLHYDFNESRCCEICFDGLNRYVRVTGREFRSFGGLRRILNIDNRENSFYEDYNGPVYWFGTNKKVPTDEVESKIMLLNGKDPRKFGQLRPHERHLLDKI
jgi:hypothetical protein